MTLLVPLGGHATGQFALVDLSDEWVLRHRWSLDGRGYVQARINGRVLTLHRLLLDFPPGLVDHKNRNRLDNRRCNLRATDARGNAQNKSKRQGMTSAYQNVYRHSQNARWVATGSLHGKSVYLGSHDTEQQAADTARQWRIRTFGYDRVPGDTPQGDQ